MDDDDRTGKTRTTPRFVPNLRPRPRNTRAYGLFTKTGTKVGASATKGYFNVIEFLQREVTARPVQSAKTARSFMVSKISLKKPSFLEAEVKKQAPEEDDAQKKRRELQDQVKRSREILVTATTVFPFTLFPDTITVDRTKLTIHKRNFFFSSDVLSIRIEDILNVSSGLGPFFGSVTIASRVMSTEDHFVINYFWKADAVKIKRLLQGYVIAQHNKIECTHLSKYELISTLSELGHDASG